DRAVSELLPGRHRLRRVGAARHGLALVDGAGAAAGAGRRGRGGGRRDRTRARVGAWTAWPARRGAERARRRSRGREGRGRGAATGGDQRDLARGPLVVGWGPGRGRTMTSDDPKHEGRAKVRHWIRIFDTPLRDGEQSPGCSMNLHEK